MWNNKNVATFCVSILLVCAAQTGFAATTGDMSSYAAQFRRLDTNGDGVLSRREAAADAHVASLYDSMDTSATIEDRAKNTMPGGISLEQFEAGMQAAKRGGVAGPAVSGGGTYQLYKNGRRKKVQGTGY